MDQTGSEKPMLETASPATPTQTSRELSQRAIAAHARLYRLIDADEPDLAANITFTIGRVTLLRLAAADPWPIEADRAAAALAFIEGAEGVSDPATAAAWFTGFAEEMHARLERRGSSGGVEPRRRSTDRDALDRRLPEPNASRRVVSSAASGSPGSR